MSILIKKFRIKSFKEERPAIELRDVTISYGTRQIVEKLNFSIQKSEISQNYCESTYSFSCSKAGR